MSTLYKNEFSEKILIDSLYTGGVCNKCSHFSGAQPAVDKIKVYRYIYFYPDFRKVWKMIRYKKGQIANATWP